MITLEFLQGVNEYVCDDILEIEFKDVETIAAILYS